MSALALPVKMGQPVWMVSMTTSVNAVWDTQDPTVRLTLTTVSSQHVRTMHCALMKTTPTAASVQWVLRVPSVKLQ